MYCHHDCFSHFEHWHFSILNHDMAMKITISCCLLLIGQNQQVIRENTNSTLPPFLFYPVSEFASPVCLPSFSPVGYALATLFWLHNSYSVQCYPVNSTRLDQYRCFLYFNIGIFVVEILTSPFYFSSDSMD